MAAQGFPLFNWGPDGNPVRRIIFNALMSHTLKSSSPIYSSIGKNEAHGPQNVAPRRDC